MSILVCGKIMGHIYESTFNTQTSLPTNHSGWFGANLQILVRVKKEALTQYNNT